jgi:hypothetical protein
MDFLGFTLDYEYNICVEKTDFSPCWRWPPSGRGFKCPSNHLRSHPPGSPPPPPLSRSPYSHLCLLPLSFFTSVLPPLFLFSVTHTVYNILYISYIILSMWSLYRQIYWYEKTFFRKSKIQNSLLWSDLKRTSVQIRLITRLHSKDDFLNHLWIFQIGVLLKRSMNTCTKVQIITLFYFFHLDVCLQRFLCQMDRIPGSMIRQPSRR